MTLSNTAQPGQPGPASHRLTSAAAFWRDRGRQGGDRGETGDARRVKTVGGAPAFSRGNKDTIALAGPE